jgi:hypothetical protein
MKKILAFLLISITISVYPQFTEYPRPNQGVIEGGLGLNWIDGELHYSFGFRPEISFVNFGVGLDLRIDVDQHGNIRKENFYELSDYLSIIRYVRYGIKRDPLYVKLGALDYHTIGHGSIMYRYNNSPSYDARKIGLVMDIDFGYFGFESIYSRFAEAGILGMRGYVRPLKFTSLGNIPILGSVEIGGTYAADFDQYSGITDGLYNQFSREFVILNDESPMTIVGADIALPLLNTSMFDAAVYYDYAKILNFGSGTSLGLILEFNSLGAVTASAKMERRFNGDNYFPAYFNSLYEIEKFRLDTAFTLSGGTMVQTPQYTSKARALKLSENISNGWYGELGVNILGLFDILGSYQRLDKDPHSGILHLGTQIAPEGVPFVMRAGYDKINIEGESDVFKLDDRSYLFFETGYKPMEYILVSVVYHWTFSPVRDSDKNIISYEPIKRIEPRISFIYPFRVEGQTMVRSNNGHTMVIRWANNGHTMVIQWSYNCREVIYGHL